MKEDVRRENKENNITVALFLVAAMVPILTLLFSFIFQKWSWGLMDDLQILESGSSIIERTVNYFQTSRAFGQFRLIWPLHCGIFYTIFEHSPDKFYIFRLFEVCVVLLLWGTATYRITGQKISIVLLPLITLSFHYFYDAVFYLSSQELIGLFFLGIAVHFFLNNFKGISLSKDINHFSWASWLAGLFSLLCAFNSKEPFVSCGMGLGFMHLYEAWRLRKKSFKMFFLAGIFLVFLTGIYALGLMIFVKSSYTSHYSMDNISKLMSSFSGWFKKDFLNHIPWLGGAAFILYLSRGTLKKNDRSETVKIRIQSGLVLGCFLYLGYLLILLPWNTVAYYATPFGIFFAFIITLLISERINSLKVHFQTVIVIFALVMNQFICQYALNREAKYQYDTANLMTWLKTEFQSEEDKQKLILCNAMEASYAIPGHINRNWGLNLKGFQWTTNPDFEENGKKGSFYLYSPRFHSIDLNKFKGWDVVFLSKHWIMYKRPESGGG